MEVLNLWTYKLWAIINIFPSWIGHEQKKDESVFSREMKLWWCISKLYIFHKMTMLVSLTEVSDFRRSLRLFWSLDCCNARKVLLNVKFYNWPSVFSFETVRCVPFSCASLAGLTVGRDVWPWIIAPICWR